MRLFLDTSVLLAACGSSTGASALIFDLHAAEGWALHTNRYAVEEVERNLPRFPDGGRLRWSRLAPQVARVRDVLTLDRPVVFAASKDRPILFSALAFTDVLLTLDAADFGRLLGGSFYGLPILKPGDFLRREREQV